MPDSPDAYGDIPYESCSHAQSHPGNLAVIATLFGMRPRSLEAARVLEIGCAGGGNLLPVAAAFPGSSFVGIDLSPRQITEARAAAADLKLGNIKFHVLALEELGPDSGTFDYIIAHGVYSWVRAEVRDKLMALCAARLAPMGVAYISYNTLPGSATRSALREMVKFHTRSISSPAGKVSGARSFFTFLESALRERSDPYALSLRDELSHAAQAEDYYIAHEYLEETNDPCYFHEFIRHAEGHGLQFLGEAEMRTLSSADFPAGVRADLREMSASVTEAGQYSDFLRDRAFRQTLLCRAEVALKRAIPSTLLPQFQFASSLEPVPLPPDSGSLELSGQFRDGDGLVIRARDPLTTAALLELRALWPGTLSFAELLTRAAARAGLGADARQAALLANSLLTCYSTSRGMELHLHSGGVFPSVSSFPKASPFARWEAGRGARVTSLRHGGILLGPAERALLRQLDGLRGLAELEEEFPRARPLLERFARQALLTA